METLSVIHGLFRWVVIVLGVVAITKLVIGLLQKSEFTKLDRQLTLFFGVSMDIQVLIGLLNLLTVGLTLKSGEHAFVMLLALAVVHLPARWKAAPDAIRFRNTLVLFVMSLVLVAIGVAVVGGWA